MTSEPLPQEVSCNGGKGQNPCFEMASTGGSNDLLFQAASSGATSSGLVSQGSMDDFMQLGDIHGVPVFASSLNSSPSVSGSNLVKNLQPVVTNKNAEYDSNTPRIVSYGPVYRLLKPHRAYISSGNMLSASDKPSVSSYVTSKPLSNGQNSYKAGFSRIRYDATQPGDTYNPVPATYISRNKPSLSGMVISSGPIITFIRPNQSDYQLQQTINKTQGSHEPGAPIKSLVTVAEPTAESPVVFEDGQGMNYERPTSQPQVPNESRSQSPQMVNKPITAPKPLLASKNPSIPQSRTTEPRFTQLGNAYSSTNKTYKPANVKVAQATYVQQMSKPVQSSYQRADFSKGVLYNSSSAAVPLTGSVYRFPRPGYIHGTSGSTGTSVYMPSNSAESEQRNYIQQLYQAGLSFPKVGYGSPPSSSAVASSETMYGFTESGNAYGSGDDAAYTSNSQPTSSSSNLIQNPYFEVWQGQRSYSMVKPVQPNYKSFPRRYKQMPFKSFNTPFSQKDSVRDSEQLSQMWNWVSPVQDATSEGFQTWHHLGPVLVPDPVQNGDQAEHLQKPVQAHPCKPKNLFDYLSRLPPPASQTVSSNYNQLQTGQSGL